MSEVLIFSVGAVLFVATTTATLILGYLRFQDLQEQDAQLDGSGPQA